MTGSDRFAGNRSIACSKQISATEFDGIDIEFPCHLVDCPFDSPQHLEMAETTIGGSEQLVCVHHIGVDPAIGDCVRPRSGVGGGAADVNAVVGIGTCIPKIRSFELWSPCREGRVLNSCSLVATSLTGRPPAARESTYTSGSR